MHKKAGIFLVTVLLSMSMISCKYKVAFNQDGMRQLQQELNDEFGSSVWYSEITILSFSDDESSIRVKVSKDPNSLKAKAWLRQSENWIPLDDIMLQFNDGKPKSHLFQLGQSISLIQLVKLIDQSKQLLNKEGVAANIKIKFASIQSAAVVKMASQRILYSISFQDTKAAKSYSFVYDLNGKLISFNR